MHLSLIFFKDIFMNWLEYRKVLLEKCKNYNIPFGVCFELTPFCNFKCNMCYIRLDPAQAKLQGSPLTTQQWIYLAQEAKKMGTVCMEITGGEAITRPDFCILYESFAKMGFLLSLRTNGYAIDGKVLEVLTKYKPRSVGITLYGASDETYNTVCGVPDGFSVVTRNILKMRELGLNPHISMTITKDNQADRSALDKWARENGFVLSVFGGLLTPIRSAQRSIKHLQIERPDLRCDLEDSSSPPPKVSNRDYYMNPFWMCRGFGVKFCISWDGRMTLCNTLTSVWKDPFSDSLEKIYKNLYNELRKVQRPEQCKNCPYIDFCFACPSKFLSETGRHDNTNDDICRIARYFSKQ